MEIILINKDLEIANEDSYAVCLGIFDGVHIGHKELMKKTVALAKEKGLKSAVLTFITKGGRNKIYPLEIQKELISAMGIDTLFIIDFNSEFMKISPETFIDNYILSYLRAKEVICGFNFRFGNNREGTTETLREHSKKGYSLTVIDKVEKNGETVSSTLIKGYLKDGNIKCANSFLEGIYTIVGTVKSGAKLGRRIEFPTVNVPVNSECIPVKCGVYAVKIKIDGRVYKGICNVGYAPTARDSGEILTETHIFDFSGDAYNKNVEIGFYDFIREEKKFDSMEILKNVIKENTETALKILEESEC